MKELKIEIWNNKNIVFMKVLEQDDEIRGNGILFIAKNGITIYSYESPKLFSKSIVINGSLGICDNNISYCYFGSEEKAKKYIKDILEAVNEYNKSLNQILTREEKEYLRVIINPFRDRVTSIVKSSWSNACSEALIIIKMKQTINVDYDIILPTFNPNEMYVGMEFDREYSPEQLGI